MEARGECLQFTDLSARLWGRGGTSGAQKGEKPPSQGEAAKAHQRPWSDQDVEEGPGIIQLSNSLN